MEQVYYSFAEIFWRIGMRQKSALFSSDQLELLQLSLSFAKNKCRPGKIYSLLSF